VQLAHDKWSYQAQGLTPAGAALLSIAVAAYAPGIGSSLISSITTAAGASAAVAVNAGFVALQAQAAVAMVNNGGDIGKTLQQLGSEQSVKNLLITMATAGALEKLNSTYFADAQPATVSGQALDGAGSASSAASIASNGLTTTQAANQFGRNLLKNVTNNVAGAAISSAINGQPLDEKALSSALTSALLTTGLASGANKIGDAAAAGDISAFTQKLAHAALGCAGGAAMAGNSSGCSAGAVGAVVGEMAADYYRNNNSDPALSAEQNKANALAFAKVMSAASGVLVGGGGDNVAAVNIANTTGTNAAANNRLLHDSEKQRIKDLAKGDPQKEARLTAAACALAKCYAQYPQDSTNYNALKDMADAGSSDAMATERQQLQAQQGLFLYSTQGLFSDKNIDAAKQLNNTYQVTTRALGTGQAVLGGLGVAGSVATAPVSCATGIGCVANASVAAISADAALAGAKQLVSGQPENTSLNNTLQALGLSPEAAGYAEFALGVGAAAKVGSVMNAGVSSQGRISIQGRGR
jgi:hypothetical protein